MKGFRSACDHRISTVQAGHFCINGFAGSCLACKAAHAVTTSACIHLLMTLVIAYRLHVSYCAQLHLRIIVCAKPSWPLLTSAHSPDASKFSCALHASVQHTFHAFTAQLSASLSPPTPPPHPVPQPCTPLAHANQSKAPELASLHHFGGELRPVSPSAVQPRAEQGSSSFTRGGSMATTPQAGPIQMQPLERVGAALGVQGSSLPLEQQQLRPEFGGIGGSAAQQAAAQQQQLQPGAGGIGGADHPAACPPRMPLARSGKQIRGTADLLLANVGSLSKVSWVEGKRGFRRNCTICVVHPLAENGQYPGSEQAHGHT
eukprot:1134079-Pelagomonas_calceolata.AAC.3